jgi:hypothetical protein
MIQHSTDRMFIQIQLENETNNGSDGFKSIIQARVGSCTSYKTLDTCIDVHSDEWVDGRGGEGYYSSQSIV